MVCVKKWYIMLWWWCDKLLSCCDFLCKLLLLKNIGGYWDGSYFNYGCK